MPVSHWGAHSTRGAGVQFFKSLGMRPEEVFELGKWKNYAAFQSHYLRVGVVTAASSRVVKRVLGEVHRISPLEGAEPEWPPPCGASE